MGSALAFDARVSKLVACGADARWSAVVRRDDACANRAAFAAAADDVEEEISKRASIWTEGMAKTAVTMTRTQR